MPYTRADLQREAEEAPDRIWFVQHTEVFARTEITFAVRLHLQEDLFVQAFLGEQSGALTFALIERGRRIFGMDREADEWHVHNYDAPDQHEMLLHGPGRRPLLAFLAQVGAPLVGALCVCTAEGTHKGCPYNGGDDPLGPRASECPGVHQNAVHLARPSG